MEIKTNGCSLINSVDNIANMLIDVESAIDPETNHIVIRFWNGDFDIKPIQVESCECHLKETLEQAQQEIEDTITYLETIKQKMEILMLVKASEPATYTVEG